jgi:AcrR family transcriptional regulator
MGQSGAGDRGNGAHGASKPSSAAIGAQESTHERVIRVATEIFARKGYHATGVQEIGEAAGIARGALYYHIRSKDDLLSEILTRYLLEAVAAARAAVAGVSDPVDQLRTLARLHLRQVQLQLAENTIWQRETHVLSGELAQKVNRIRDEYEEIWGEILQRGVDEGRLKLAEPIVRKGIIGMIGYTYMWLRPGELTPEEVADRLMDVVLSGLLIDDDDNATAAPVKRKTRTKSAT